MHTHTPSTSSPRNLLCSSGHANHSEETSHWSLLEASLQSLPLSSHGCLPPVTVSARGLLCVCVCVCVCVCSVTQLCLTLCDLMECSPPGSSAHGISQARILEWIAISFSRGSPQTRDQTCISWVSCIAGGFFTW